jgi:hypothetical protein
MSPLALGRWNGNRNELIEYSLAFVLGQLRRERLGESFVVPWPRSEVKHLAQQRPRHGKVGDVQRSRRLTERPVYMDIRDQRRNNAVELGEDRSDDDERSHSEGDEQHSFLFGWKPCGDDKW